MASDAPPTPPAGDPLPAWVLEQEAEHGDLGDLAKDLPTIAGLVVAVLLFLAFVIAIVLTVIAIAKFPWLAG